jgi:purine-binding chemotaxis protein CheW
MNDQNKPEKTEHVSKLQVTTFIVDNKLFGIPIQDVLEINKNLDLTPVPLAPDYIRGVLNLRGQIVTALDLRRRLKMTAKDVDDVKLFHNVIIGNRNDSLSLLVDEIGDVLDIPSNIIEEPPETIKGMDAKFVKNVCKLQKELLVVLDTQKIQTEE